MLKYDIQKGICQISMKEKLNSTERLSSGEKLNNLSYVFANISDEKKTVLLHSCCGPCSTACIERLVGNFDVTVFFFNPNITDLDEYEKRKKEQIRFIDEFNLTVNEEDRIKYIEGEYIVQEYYDFVRGLEKEPEGGKRCTECFKLRLERTAQICKELKMDYFTTTLTVSPHKNSPLISAIGNSFANIYEVRYLDIDFKKKDGYKRSIELSKEYNLYRQNYCGCEFSKWFLKCTQK